jgi:cation/acetate symporter
LPNWVIALVAAGGLAAALSTAAGLLLVISSSIAHDLYVHFIEPNATEQKRVLVGRIMVVVAVVVAGYFGVDPPGFVAEVVAFAFGLAAASFFPILFLGIFSRRVNHYGVIAGMLTGILFTGGYIACEKFLGVDFKTMFRDWYIASEGIGTVGCALNFAVTIIVSRLTSPPSEKVLAIVDEIRQPDELEG